MKKLMKATHIGRSNMQNAKYRDVTKKPTNTKMLQIDDQEDERVKEFKCLGIILTEDVIQPQKLSNEQ